MTYPLYYTIAFLGSLIAGLILTPLAANLARLTGIVDMPGARKVHTTPTPRVGGVSIFIAMFCAAFPLMLVMHFHRLLAADNRIQTLILLGSSGAIFIVGLLDDFLTLPSKYKLGALLIAAAIFSMTGQTIDVLLFKGHFLYDLGWAAGPATILWMMSVPICINFIDGIDGLAGGIMAIACGVLAVVASAAGSVVVGILALALAGALLGFLVFNKHPAKVFMGDCGSMFIGFVFAGLAVLASARAGTVEAIGLPMLVLAIPILDTASTLVRRQILHRRSMFSAERGHIHHRFLEMGLGVKHTAIVLNGATLLAAIAGIVVLFTRKAYGTTALVLYAAVLLAVFRAAGSIRLRETVAAIRRNRHLGRETHRYNKTFEELQVSFRNVRNFNGWWEQVCVAADQFDFQHLRLPLARRDGETYELAWTQARVMPTGSSIKMSLPVPQRRFDSDLKIEVEIPPTKYLELAGKRVALFSRLIDENNITKLAENTASPSALSAIFGWRSGGRVKKRKRSREEDGSRVDAGKTNQVRPLSTARVAVVHDFLYVYAGAEKVLEQILEVFPEADLFSLFDFVPEEKRGFLKGKKSKTTFIQKMPFAKSKHRAYLPLMPLAIEQLDMSKYDLIISSSYMAAKGVITKPDQLHICYCHTPVRFAWDLQGQYLNEAGLVKGLKSLVARIILHYTRIWDVRSANGVDIFLTNSHFVARRIEKVYRRSSTVVYPPVDVERFTCHTEKQEYYVTASRLVSYKRVDLIVEAFSRMPEKRLVVVGEGPELERLRAMAGENVRLVGHQPFERLRTFMQHGKAFIFAAEEDFGIVPVEAQACGTPVIAFGRGGVTESVIDGKTGIFFPQQTAESIVEAVKRFEQQEWNPAVIRQNAERFAHAEFTGKLYSIAETAWDTFEDKRVNRATQSPTDEKEPLLANLPDLTVAASHMIEKPASVLAMKPVEVSPRIA